MRLNAVAVASSNIPKTLEFYKILGFKFEDHKPKDSHIETVKDETSIKLMIDSISMMKEILGEEPKPGNSSSFAVLYDNPEEVNEVAKKIESAGFTIEKQPWDAFWGQRYCIVKDPDGYLVDLYAQLDA